MENIFSYSGLSGILGSDRKQTALKKLVLGGLMSGCPVVLINKLNTTDSAVFQMCRFSLFLKDPFFQVILGPSRDLVIRKYSFWAPLLTTADPFVVHIYMAWPWNTNINKHIYRRLTVKKVVNGDKI